MKLKQRKQYCDCRSFLVFNYLKERQDQNNYEEPSQKFILPMEYTEYMPQGVPSINNRMKHRSFYANITKKTSPAKNITTIKKIYESPMEYMNHLSSEEKISSKVRFSVAQEVKGMPQLAKHSCSLDSHREIDSKNKTKNQNAMIEKVHKARSVRKSKYYYTKKFGLDIQQINLTNNNIKLQLGGTTQVRRKIQQKITLDAIYNNSVQQSPCQPLSKKQQKFPTQNSEKVISTSKNKINPSVFKTMKKFKIKKSIIQQRSPQNRIEKMLDFLSIVLYSFACYTKRQQQKIINKSPANTLLLRKKKNKFSYFVGAGNNKYLIVSLMKKRWWWVQTDDINNADFVWTQTKVYSILQKQKSMNFSDMQFADVNTYKTLQAKNSIIDPHLKKLFHVSMDKKFSVKLGKEAQKNYFRELKTPEHIHNHYQANYMLGNKKALFHNLSFYCEYAGLNVFDYIPQTFHVERIGSRSWRTFEAFANLNKNMVWIVKPGQNTNRGKGIFVCDSAEKIKNKIQGKSKAKKNQSRTYIIQKYITNLFLFQRRKFDIRTYMLITTIGGITKFSWYGEGYLRTSSEFYDLSDLEDPFIHLTNDAVQVKSDSYGKFQNGNKISYHQFQRYLDSVYPNEKYSVKQLHSRMKNIALQAVKSTYFQIDPISVQESFELFGLDFIVDSNFRPWLLQINTNPCLELSSPSLERLLPRMLQNAFRITLDPIFQPSQDCPRTYAYYIPENMLQNNRFQLIFDSLFDRDPQLQVKFAQWQKSKQGKDIQYEDQDEVFEGDGELIVIDF